MEESARDKIQVIVLIGLTSLFLLNDLSNIFVKNYITWLSIDYTIRIIVLSVIFYLIKNRIAGLSDFGLKRIRIPQLISLTVLLSIAGILLEWVRYFLLEAVFLEFLGVADLGGIPKIENPVVLTFDLSIGLILVAISEEVIFRGFYFTILKRYINADKTVIYISAFVFGLCHWSFGLDDIINDFIWAILYMRVMLKTGSVIPGIIAHFFTDFLIFYAFYQGYETITLPFLSSLFSL